MVPAGKTEGEQLAVPSHHHQCVKPVSLLPSQNWETQNQPLSFNELPHSNIDTLALQEITCKVRKAGSAVLILSARLHQSAKESANGIQGVADPAL